MSTLSGRARAEKKVRRQKQFLAVGSVVLLAILGFEMAKLLSHGGEEAVAPVGPAKTSSSVAGPTTPSSGWRLPETDRIIVERTPDQLISFGLFGSKDPFVQQLSAAPSPAAAPAAPAPAAPAPAARTSAKPRKPLGVVPTPVTSTTPAPSAPPGPSATGTAHGASPAPPATTTSPSTPTAPETAPTTVLISTNGACETVVAKGRFPSGADIFRLVSIARDGKSVEIGIVGGSYDSGQAAATLKLGGKLTLVNTSDGTRYVIELKSKCDVLVRPSSATGDSPSTTTTTPTTVPPATTTTTPATVPPATTIPAPTVTTPIVPDSLDTTTTPTQ